MTIGRSGALGDKSHRASAKKMLDILPILAAIRFRTTSACRQLSQDPNLQPLPQFVIGVVLANSAGDNAITGNPGQVAVWDTLAGSETATGVVITCYPWADATIPVGSKVFCMWNCQENAWYCFLMGAAGNSSSDCHTIGGVDFHTFEVRPSSHPIMPC